MYRSVNSQLICQIPTITGNLQYKSFAKQLADMSEYKKSQGHH
jgi:hypothetical protein